MFFSCIAIQFLCQLEFASRSSIFPASSFSLSPSPSCSFAHLFALFAIHPIILWRWKWSEEKKKSICYIYWEIWKIHTVYTVQSIYTFRTHQIHSMHVYEMEWNLKCAYRSDNVYFSIGLNPCSTGIFYRATPTILLVCSAVFA